MRRWILLVGLLASGCTAMETTRFVAPVLPGAGTSDVGPLERDERECAAYAVERPSEMRYATYVACLVARGHRTYASLVARQGATGVTLQSTQRKAAPDVYRDLEHCARTVRARVDMPPDSETFKGARAEKLTLESQTPFAQCLNAAGYTTTLHSTPEAVVVATMPPAPAPGPVMTAPSGATATPPPSAPVISTPPAPPLAPKPPAIPAPPTVGAPSSRVAMAPPSATPRQRPVRLGLYLEPGSKPPVISIVASDTPAGRAGVRPGDVVLRVDGKPVVSEDDIAAVLATKVPDDVVRIDLRRGGQQMSVEAILAGQ